MMGGRKCEPGCICLKHPKGKLSYGSLHRIVGELRGKATEQSCVRCDKPAHEWARIHTEDGTNYWADYVPMCRSCHKIYDKIGNNINAVPGRVPWNKGLKGAQIAWNKGKPAEHLPSFAGRKHTLEARAKIGAASRGKPWTEARRAAQSKGN